MSWNKKDPEGTATRSIPDHRDLVDREAQRISSMPDGLAKNPDGVPLGPPPVPEIRHGE